MEGRRLTLQLYLYVTKLICSVIKSHCYFAAHLNIHAPPSVYMNTHRNPSMTTYKLNSRLTQCLVTLITLLVSLNDTYTSDKLSSAISQFMGRSCYFALRRSCASTARLGLIVRHLARSCCHCARVCSLE